MYTGFIEGSCLVSSIMNVKSKYFDENFVKSEEFHYIKNKIQGRINNSGLHCVITDLIDNIYFYIQDGIIICNKKNSITVEDAIEHFEMYISSYEVEQIILDEEFIYNALLELKENELNKIKLKQFVKKI